MVGEWWSYIVGGSALTVVCFHSLLDETEEDKEATMAMLKVLFAKKVDPALKFGQCYWIKPREQKEDVAFDFVGFATLEELLQKSCCQEVQELVRAYIASYTAA